MSLSLRGTPPQKGDCPPHEGDRGSPCPEGDRVQVPLKTRGYFSLCITIYMIRKNHNHDNCKKRQWCLWRFIMCPLSMHQFIEISICELENNFFSNISMSSDPWNFCAPTPTGLPGPCTAAETIGRTKLPSSVASAAVHGNFGKTRIYQYQIRIFGSVNLNSISQLKFNKIF